MEKDLSKKLRDWGYFSAAMMATEYPVSFIVKALTGTSMLDRNMTYQSTILHWALTIIIWVSWAIFMNMKFKKNKINLITVNFGKNSFLLMVTAIILGVGINFIILPVYSTHIKMGYESFVKIYGKDYALLVNSIQILYYFAEIFIVSTIATLFQNGFEMKTGNTKIPYGGIGIGILWGGLHLFSGHAGAALPLLILSILVGILYIKGNKNFFILYLGLLASFLF